MLLFTVTFFIKCDYEFSEDYYEEIILEEPTASLNLINFEDDQKIKGFTQINFEYSGENKHRLFQTAIYIDDSLILNNSDESGSFNIDPFNLTEGLHTITIEYYFSSGSGSLADMSNLETYKIIENYSFIVDKSLADAFSISSVKIEDGTINVYWEEVLDYNFDIAYLIVKNDNREVKREILSEDMIKSKTYNDNFSVSGELSYQIKLQNNFDFAESNIVNIENIDFPIPTYKILNKNSVQVSIGKHVLYNNFDFYKFSSSLNNNQQIELDKLGGDLVFNFENDNNLDESFYSNFTLYKNNTAVDFINFNINWGNKFDLTYVKEFIYDENTESYYALDLEGPSTYQSPRTVVIYQLNNEDMSIIRSSELLTVYDETSDLILDPFTGNLIVDLEKTSLIVDIKSLNILKEYNSTEFLPSGNKSDKVMYRNKRIFVNESFSQHTYIYNSETKEQLHDLNLRYIDLTDNGNYLWDKGSDIYKIENSNVTTAFTIPSTGYTSNFIFIDGQDRCIYNRFYGVTYLLDLKTNNTTQLSNSTEVRNFEYDNITNKVLLRFYGNATLIDLDTDRTYDFEYDSYNEHIAGYKLKILNNKLISSKGYYLDYFEK
jgi:hypothetical protein